MARYVSLALAVLALAAGPVAAGPPSDDLHFRGGCGFESLGPAGGTTWSGEVHGYGVGYSTWHEHNPVTVRYLTCELFVDSTSVATVTGTGTGPVVVAGPEPVTFTADPDQIVYLCESYELVDAHGRTETVTDACAFTPAFSLIPDEVYEVYEYYAREPAGVVWGVVDPPVCAARAGQAGTYGGLVTVEPDGDVYAGDGLVYDCPPYETR